MNLRVVLKNLCLILVVALSITACKKDKQEMVASPVINNFEVGYANGKVVNQGSDLHLEAKLLAAGSIATIKVDIQPVTAGGWTFSKTYTEGYEDTKNATFHEHIDVPANAAIGSYNLRLIVTDKNGNATTEDVVFKVELKDPSAALVFTKVTGDASLYAHGDHFHGLAGGVEGASVTITFDEKGIALTNGHLHLEAAAIYKVSLKTYGAEGVETQNKYIANAAAAADYKAFLVGGNFVLNANTTNEQGAIFQTRETVYADGTTVTGGATFTTGVTTYFTAGAVNKMEKEVKFLMRKLNAGVKTTITRNDWNRNDYATAFAGTDELTLKFELHTQ